LPDPVRPEPMALVRNRFHELLHPGHATVSGGQLQLD
jgi:hypothetical protein